MEKKFTVKLSTIVDEHELEIVYISSDFNDVRISSSDVSRPGLQLFGFYDYFDRGRMQILGKGETACLRTFTSEERLAAFRSLLSRRIPALVICHGMDAFPECIHAAREANVSVLRTELDTSEFLAQLIGTLRLLLAPRETRHGVLVEVHGEGLLITGESGIGKSETALELIKRGHRLIADDAVEIKRTSRHTLMGSSPEIIRNFMELRGIGVIDVLNTFGAGAVKRTTRIDLVVAMENWDSDKHYDRLGIDTEQTSILGVVVPMITIPVRPGRNLAVILELAAMNNRQKNSGYNAALELAKKVDSNVDAGWINPVD